MNLTSSATPKYGPNRPLSARMARRALHATLRHRQPPRSGEPPLKIAPRRYCRRQPSSKLETRARQLATWCSRSRPTARLGCLRARDSSLTQRFCGTAARDWSRKRGMSVGKTCAKRDQCGAWVGREARCQARRRVTSEHVSASPRALREGTRRG